MNLSDSDLEQISEANAVLLIRRSPWSWPHGRMPAISIGSASSGLVGHAVLTVANAGSELLIFVPRAAHGPDVAALGEQ
jgi:hypothetical protein